MRICATAMKSALSVRKSPAMPRKASTRNASECSRFLANSTSSAETTVRPLNTQNPMTTPVESKSLELPLLAAMRRASRYASTERYDERTFCAAFNPPTVPSVIISGFVAYCEGA